MTVSDHQAFLALLRRDFGAFLHRCVLTLSPGTVFLPNWHIEAIAWQLQQVQAGQTTRLIINMPPRYLKSLAVSVAFPAFLLGHDPRRRLICISYGNDLSAKHAADFRAVVQAPWYQQAFPQMRVARVADSDLFTTQRGFRRATSVNAALTGLGGDCFIIDDPQKPVDAQSETLRNSLNQWHANTLVSRLDNKETGVIIVVMQRVHLNDLSGYLLAQAEPWASLSLPAIAETDETIALGEDRSHHRRAGAALHPARESLATLERLRAELGSDVFAAQYQQAPVPPGGAMIRRAWLRYYDQLPPRTATTKVIQSWDTAAKAGAQHDWSVCTTWLIVDRRHYYLLDVSRGRHEYPRLRDTALALAERYRPDTILIENASTGMALEQELRQLRRWAVRLVTVEHDKIGRLYVQQGKFEAGQVLFPAGARFLPELEAELLTFPHGKTDDQVDSLTQALALKHYGYDTSLRWVTGE
ncbi:MAG TPA: phage terminase large subunit [Xanthobacteraceae bacterium]|nr:phage terminase large subunit [Xanthobacteraceae bacterium]